MKLIMYVTVVFIVSSGWKMWVYVPMHVYVHYNMVYLKDNKLKQKNQERFHTFNSIWLEVWIEELCEGLERGKRTFQTFDTTWNK